MQNQVRHAAARTVQNEYRRAVAYRAAKVQLELLRLVQVNKTTHLQSYLRYFLVLLSSCMRLRVWFIGNGWVYLSQTYMLK